MTRLEEKVLKAKRGIKICYEYWEKRIKNIKNNELVLGCVCCGLV